MPYIFDELNHINWSAPWHAHLQENILTPQFYKIKQSNDSQQLSLAATLNQLLSTHKSILTGADKPAKFITQTYFDSLPNTQAYEAHIAKTGQIPTRDNLHDLFNAWIWFTFPQTKAMLNRYQSLQIARDGISNARGRVRDAITIFDECGAIFVTSEESIAQALKNFDWQHCLVKSRDTWDNPLKLHTIKNANSSVYIFGHATLEQLVEPRKPICSHCKIVLVEADFFKLTMTERMCYLDKRLAIEVAEWLEQDNVQPRDLSPLPILGIPHFWNENKNAEFYEDAFVFRSGRRKK